MGNIGRILAFVITAAAAAGVILVGSENPGGADKLAASEIRRAVDPNVVVVEDPVAPQDSQNASAAKAGETPTEMEPARSGKDAAERTGNDDTDSVAEKPTAKADDVAEDAGKTEAETAQAPREISDFSLVPEDGGFTLNVVGASPSDPVKWFTLQAPKRFVIDIPGSWDIRGENVFRIDSAPVRHVVAGVHSDKVRFVIHYREDAVLPDGPPVADGQKGLLSLTVR